MSRPAVPTGDAAEPASSASPPPLARSPWRRSFRSLQVLLPAMVVLASLAAIVQQYLVTLYLGGGERGALPSALTSGALVFCVGGLFWLVVARMLLRPLDDLLSTPERDRPASEALTDHGRPMAELVRIADALDSLKALTHEHERTLSGRDRLARIVEESRAEVYVVDAETLRVADTNRAAREALGYTADELARLHLWDIVGPNEQDDIEIRVREQIDALKREESALHVLNDGWNLRKDGSIYPVSVQVQYFGAENPPVIVGICQDVTEQRRRDERLHLQERAIESVRAGIIISDASVEGYPIVYANRALCEMSGYALDELLGRPPNLLQGEARRQEGVLQVQEAQALGAPVQTRLDCVRKDGSRFVIRLTLSPVTDADGVRTHYIGIHEDITQELETEARLLQAQRIDAVGQLAGGVAHDFNNLLDIIVGNLELLARHSAAGAERERVEEALRAANMGARLTRRLLAFARQGKLEPCVHDINERVRDTLPLLRSSVGESIVLDADLEEALWNADVDPSEIENTLVNLVLNARDAIDGEGRIRVTTANARAGHGAPDDLSPGAYVCLSVVDDGRGMSEAVRARAFEPFFTTKELHRGTGLGLASVHGFARQSGGSVDIDSEPGRGTTVRVYLPRADDRERRSTPSESASAHDSALEGRVLVVEDNDKVREVTCLRLQALGLETLEASDGRDAKRLLTSGERVDLVLSDVVMPGGLSGHDLARWMHTARPACPILLVSGFADPTAAHDGLDDAPPAKVLFKPYGLQALREAIDDILGPDRR